MSSEQLFSSVADETQTGVIRAAADYRNPGDLCVIMCLFNLGRTQDRLQNFKVCYSPLRTSGIPVVVVECAFGNDPWVVDPSVAAIRLRTLTPLWQKERLINHALFRVPDRCTKVAWLDADILFQNRDWAVRASQLLDDLAVVQLDDRIIRLPRGCRAYAGVGDTWKSFGAVYAEHPNAMLFGDFGCHGHTGLGWAARRSVLDHAGLYDACIAGGADHVMAHVFCGDWDSPCLTLTMGRDSDWHRHAVAWAEKVYPLVRARVGVVEGSALHLWHGDIGSRQYNLRDEALRSARFDPDKDLDQDEAGCWRWASNKLSLHAAVENYLAARRTEADPPKKLGAAVDRWSAQNNFQDTFAIPRPNDTQPTRVSLAGRLTVVVLTHERYLPWLQEVLASIQKQSAVIDDLVLVVNSAEASLPDLRSHDVHKVIVGFFGTPNEARNRGLSEVNTEWVCYVDGDNVPDPGYFGKMLRLASTADDDVAIIYPNLRRIDGNGNVSTRNMPEWDYWNCRERSIVDTCSIWRTKALRQVGGWFLPAPCLQDYATVLQITKLGWKVKKALDVVATLREHENNLSKQVGNMAEVLWHCRRVVAITPFAGRTDTLSQLMDWYLHEEFPPDTHLLWIDDSENADFNSLLWRYADPIRTRVASVQVLKNQLSQTDKSNFHALHDHIAAMYCLAFSSTIADVYLTVEDDVIAPVGSVRLLLGSPTLRPFTQWAGVCAVYPSRNSKDKSYMVASSDRERWTKIPIIAEFPLEIVEMGFIGAGFTAWSGAAIHKVLPVHSGVVQSNHLLGWDGTLCRKLRDLGYKVGVDGRVRCKHYY